MRQEDGNMERPNFPIVIMPRVYELPLSMWRWCKLVEVCSVVPGVALLAGNQFTLTPEDLVRNFAGLARPNRPPSKEKKFRYSVGGKSIMVTDVPTKQTDPGFPPHNPFTLGIGAPYPRELFVPEGWVIDVLKAIRKGAKAAADYGDTQIGYLPDNKGMIRLDKRPGMVLLRQPTVIF